MAAAVGGWRTPFTAAANGMAGVAGELGGRMRQPVPLVRRGAADI